MVQTKTNWNVEI